MSTSGRGASRSCVAATAGGGAAPSAWAAAAISRVVATPPSRARRRALRMVFPETAITAYGRKPVTPGQPARAICELLQLCNVYRTATRGGQFVPEVRWTFQQAQRCRLILHRTRNELPCALQ